MPCKKKFRIERLRSALELNTDCNSSSSTNNGDGSCSSNSSDSSYDTKKKTYLSWPTFLRRKYKTKIKSFCQVAPKMSACYMLPMNRDSTTNKDLNKSRHKSSSIILKNNIGSDLEDVINSNDEFHKFMPKPELTLFRAVAVRWTIVLTKGLNSEQRSHILSRYKIPDNCSSMNPPKLNEELDSYLTAKDKEKDKYSEERQRRIACCLAAVGVALNDILEQHITVTNLDLARTLGDVGKLLCDIHYSESMCRRLKIINSVKRPMKQILKTSIMDDYLFGSDLSGNLRRKSYLRSSDSHVRYKIPSGSLHKKLPSRKTLSFISKINSIEYKNRKPHDVLA